MKYIIYNENIRISYNIYGKGSFPLLCFHGYGQSSEVYSIYENTLGKNYILYSFDLFYHGESVVLNNSTNNLTEEMVNIMKYFIKENNIEEFGVFGYSIGCRPAMLLIDNFYDRIKYVMLGSPEFLYERWLFKFLTRNIFGKTLFKFVVRNNNIFFYIVYFLYVVGIIKKSVYGITALNLRYKHRIRKVYKVWNLYSRFQYNHNVLEKLGKDVKLEIYLAKDDSIVKNKKIENILNNLNHYFRFEKIYTNHFNLLYAINDLLKKENKYVK